MDGTIVASALVKTVGDRLGSLLVNEFSLLWGVKKDLESLESTLATIKDVLEDAEQSCTNNKQVYNWLRKLKEVVYDADDLLDKIYMETEMREAKSYGQTSKVIGNLSKLNPVKRLKLGHKIKLINKRLDTVAIERAKFHLQSNVVQNWEIDIKERQTWSKVDECDIFGRDREKEQIISCLMQIDNQENVSVISIVGLGGVGKTTLAQLAYNNENELKGYFDLKIWVYVSQNFDLERIVRAMIESVTQEKCELENLDSLAQKLSRELNAKRFLFVLDDVWNERQEKWEKLKYLFKVGASGSKIIITTRSMKVSQIMEATFHFNLKRLSEDTSWILFQKRILGGSERSLDSRFLEIGKEIMKKCGGMPLALRAIGSIMQFKVSIEEWLAVRDSDIWDLGDLGNQVMSSLKLSYLNLPPQLKECFTYCSIFPKGQVINKLELIGQWIAHRFVSLPNSRGTTIEDKGNEYFMHLVQMSFLQNVVEHKYGKVSCKMHELVHDLARSIVADQISVVTGSVVPANTDSSSRYMSLINCAEKVEATVTRKVRAVYFNSSERLNKNAHTFAKAKSLRSLDLETNTLSVRFSKCIHLRYIRLSRVKFPQDSFEAIFTLWRLEALHLKHCDGEMYIPETIGKLVRLRTLELDCCNIKCLPESICQCQSLQHLIVNSVQLEYIPKSLGTLQNIRLFNFSGCSSLHKVHADVFGRVIFLRNISFHRCSCLQELPDSIGNIANLESLDLSFCSGIRFLPESIGNLQNLHDINLKWSEIEMLPSSIGKLINLEVLNLDCCFKLRELRGCYREMKKLRYLYIEDCPLVGLPDGIGKLTHLQRLGSFPVSEERTYACISELEHLNFLSHSLEISGLQNLNNPTEAVQANLKKKKNLEHLTLSWKCLDQMATQSNETATVAVLEALQPPSSIKNFNIYGYEGEQYSSWMMLEEMEMPPFPKLTCLTLDFLKNCYSLPRLVELPHLRDLSLLRMDSLVSISSRFPSLVRLHLSDMPNLELVSTNLVLWEDRETNKAYESAFPHLLYLEIRNCPKLRMRPNLPPSVVKLEISNSNKELLAAFTLHDGEGSSNVSLSFFSVKKLNLEKIEKCPEWSLLGHLGSLVELNLHSCELPCLPESMRYLSFLRILWINNCKGLHSLPEWMGQLVSLERLVIWDTPLTGLPQSMKQLICLRQLYISGCPELGRRCKRETGGDWYLISHIPEVKIL